MKASERPRPTPTATSSRQGAQRRPPPYGVRHADTPQVAESAPLADTTPAAGSVQLDGEGRGSTQQVRGAARRGTSGAGTSLPHLAKIQASFGRHDVSSIVAHLDARAAAGARAMGARAFTTGEHVAFAAEPSLRLAAHEAAHVVQQRHGVDLPGGVGARGDRYEQQADAVAERVVRGESAEALLGTPTRGVARPGPVQRWYDAEEMAERYRQEQEAKRGAPEPAQEAPNPEEEEKDKQRLWWTIGKLVPIIGIGQKIRGAYEMAKALVHGGPKGMADAMDPFSGLARAVIGTWTTGKETVKHGWAAIRAAFRGDKKTALREAVDAAQAHERFEKEAAPLFFAGVSLKSPSPVTNAAAAEGAAANAVKAPPTPPQLAPPKVPAPQITPPKVAAPQVATPQVAAPKVRPNVDPKMLEHMKKAGVWESPTKMMQSGPRRGNPEFIAWGKKAGVWKNHAELMRSGPGKPTQELRRWMKQAGVWGSMEEMIAAAPKPVPPAAAPPVSTGAPTLPANSAVAKALGEAPTLRAPGAAPPVSVGAPTLPANSAVAKALGEAPTLRAPGAAPPVPVGAPTLPANSAVAKALEQAATVRLPGTAAAKPPSVPKPPSDPKPPSAPPPVPQEPVGPLHDHFRSGSSPTIPPTPPNKVGALDPASDGALDRWKEQLDRLGALA